MKVRLHARRAKTRQQLALGEHMRRRRTTLHKVRIGTRWLGEDAFDAADREVWKKSGQVFSVVDDGVELFAKYQFLRIEGRLQPNRTIRQVLQAFGPVDDPWAVAAWFHFANAWLVDRAGGHAKHFSPAQALQLGMDDRVVRAAHLRLGSYIA